MSIISIYILYIFKNLYNIRSPKLSHNMTINNSQMQQLHQIITTFQQTLTRSNYKNTIQIQIFQDYVRLFSKHSQKLISLSNKINQQILNAQDQNQQSIANIYQHLSNSLLRIADCSKNVSNKAKNQVLDPMKLFVDNYKFLNSQLIIKLKNKQNQLSEKYAALIRNKDSYLNASDKLEKNRKIQPKSLAKIQNGDLYQLQKFNNNAKKMTQSIKISEEQYTQSVTAINETYKYLRSDLRDTLKSISHNEQSRISFSRKNLASSIRILEDWKNAYDCSIEKKIEDSLKKNQEQKSDPVIKKNLSVKISTLAGSKFKQQFVSYQDLAKQKRKKNLEQQNTYLNQIFTQVTQEDKKIIRILIKPWFTKKVKKSSSSQTQSPTKIKKQNLQQIDYCKQKILSITAYSYYFIQLVYQQILDMSSLYTKLAEDDFMLLLSFFVTITNNLDLQQNTLASALAIQFVYKMTQISVKIMWKKKSKTNKSQPIELLCHHYGSKCKGFSNQINLKKLYLFIQKKKAQKKSIQQNQIQPKTFMGNFVKGIATAIKSKKEPPLNQDQIFTCLIQLTEMMANLLVPSQISIPFIKSLLGKNQNAKAFEYLKQILLQKKDIQQRQKMFLQNQIKAQKEQQMRKILETKKQAHFCIKLTAKRGFFSKQQINLRLVCKQLKNIHQQILCHLDMKSVDWIHLIPLDRKLDYVAMKQEVAQNSVPSAVQQIITLDVNRSLHNHGEVLNPTVLHSLLRIYAYFHKDISYCQGMNYIAGYLYIKTKDQQSAYRIFQYLMQSRFKQLFANQFQVLKVKMYQFERLLSIFHQQISDHFKKNAITPQCYIVSWIITLFASSYQYTMDSYLIDILWQRFIIWGWGQFFKFILSLFNMFKKQLVQLTYDKALHFLGEMGRSEMFLTGRQKFKIKYPDNRVEQGMQDYPITEQLLQSLKKQYKMN